MRYSIIDAYKLFSYIAPTRFGAIIPSSLGNQHKISLKHAAIKWIAIYIHMLWYQQCRTCMYALKKFLGQLPKDGGIRVLKHVGATGKLYGSM